MSTNKPSTGAVVFWDNPFNSVKLQISMLTPAWNQKQFEVTLTYQDQRKVESSAVRPAMPSQGNRSWQWQKHTQNLFGKPEDFHDTRM